MKIEVRADNTVHITGYVNATEKKSRPVITPHGKCIEVVEARAFVKCSPKVGQKLCGKAILNSVLDRT